METAVHSCYAAPTSMATTALRRRKKPQLNYQNPGDLALISFQHLGENPNLNQLKYGFLIVR